MKAYNDLLVKILNEGEAENDERTGVGTIALFGEQIKFDLRKGFPAVTTKKLAFKAVIAEMLWFLRGSDDLFELRALTHGEEFRYDDSKRTIWDDNYYNQGAELGYTGGEMGDIYGVQWRNFGRCTLVELDESYKVVQEHEFEIDGIDQIRNILVEAKRNPGSRRLLVNAYNPRVTTGQPTIRFGQGGYRLESKEATLPPCHTGFQLNISNGHLDLLWQQRSVDVFLGLPFNIASYASIAMSFARILGLTPRYLTGQLGNTHIYNNHRDQVLEQLSRKDFDAPKLIIADHLKTLHDFETAVVDDFKLENYQSHAAIKAPMAV